MLCYHIPEYSHSVYLSLQHVSDFPLVLSSHFCFYITVITYRIHIATYKCSARYVHVISYLINLEMPVRQLIFWYICIYHFAYLK